MTISARTGESGQTVVDVGPTGVVIFRWAPGVDAYLVRGTTDLDRTAIALRSPNGTLKYLLIADDNTVTASATAP
jgi:hypothetical protein